MVRTHQGAVRAFLRRLCQNTAEADDLAQDTFIKAMGRMEDVRDDGAVKSWLFSIAYHHFIDTRRTSTRRATIRQEHSESLVTRGAQSPPGLSLDLSRALDALPPDCRACVMLSLSHGMSHGEIARVTALPLGTVKSHITRGRARLRAALADYDNHAKPSKVST